MKNPSFQRSEAQLEKVIQETRHSYYQNYSTKSYKDCLFDVKLLMGYHEALFRKVPSFRNRLELGATVCLQTRTHFLLRQFEAAREFMSSYLGLNMSFYEDLTHVGQPHKQLDSLQRENLVLKLALIANIANVCQSIDLNCLKQEGLKVYHVIGSKGLYTIYGKHVILIYGADSIEASNCYFMYGAYFAEKGDFLKAIASFQKAADLRTSSQSADCYYNIAIMYYLLKNQAKAHHSCQKALKLRVEKYGAQTDEYAQVSELLGAILLDMGDYKESMINLRHAFQIRAKVPQSKQYFQVVDKIQMLYDRLCLFIEREMKNLQKPEIYTHLKFIIESQEAYWENHQGKRNSLSNFDIETAVNMKGRQGRQTQKGPVLREAERDPMIKVSDGLKQKLTLPELYYLADLTLELERCKSQYELAVMVSKSNFYQGLSQQNKQTFGKQNKELIQMMNLEKIGHNKPSQQGEQRNGDQNNAFQEVK